VFTSFPSDTDEVTPSSLLADIQRLDDAIMREVTVVEAAATRLAAPLRQPPALSDSAVEDILKHAESLDGALAADT
jgi:hypothetical protein